MSTSWQPLSDDIQLSMDDQVRVSVSFACAPLSRISAADISNFYARQQAVKAVLNVEEGWIDSFTLGLNFSCNYLVTVNPQPGVTPAALRAALYTALSQANETHAIKSDEILVGTIERQTTSILPSAPKTTTAVSLVAIAVLGIVALVFFLKLD
jgi:hypothetical protein